MRPEPPTDAIPSDHSTAILEAAHPLTTSGTVDARFQEMAARWAEKTAIRCHQDTLSYRELNARANRLAHAIRERISSEPTRIALLFHQGPHPLIALLAVLKAGHAFVPLDAADPPARLATILQDCDPGLLITDDVQAELASELCGERVPLLNLEHLAEGLSEENPPAASTPESLAYIFYTSGSTGQPKGVCQWHRNILHYIGCYCDALKITHHDRFSLLYTMSFSASNMDVFGSLLYGATLCPYNIRQRGTAELADWLDHEKISVLHAVPTVYRHLLQNLKDARTFPSIRCIDLGGEAVHPSDVALSRRHFSEECLLVNHLASTEFCVIAQFPVDRGCDYTCDMLPVGRAPAGSFVRVLRDDGSEADVDEPGNMVIHSPFLSPGYWRRADLNEKAFASDPQRPGWRTYTSGDLGFMNADGDLCFLGRKDFRVKIRGISIDTSEIEAALRECDWIRNVAVIAKEEDGEESTRRLVAYLETAAEEERKPGKLLVELRVFLQKRLPAYMIPAEFVFLESLPRTASGKLDRKALVKVDAPPATADDESEAQEDGDVSSDEVERCVRRLFEEILRQKNVRGGDDFFVLGGDSLKATQLHLELEGALGLRLPLEKLFSSPTVTGITAFVKEWRASGGGGHDLNERTILVPLREEGTFPPLFLTHGAKGQAFVSPHFLDILGNEQPVYAFQAMGLDRTRMPGNTIEAMASEYVRALREVQPTGPYFLGSICVGAVVTLEMARQLIEAGESVGPLLIIDPPVVPPGHHRWWKRFKRTFRAHVKKMRFRPDANHKLVRKLREKQEQGTNVVDLENVDFLTEAAHTAYDFELALLKHRLAPFDGPVLILRSTERQAKHERRRHEPDKLKYPLRGETHVWEVEGRHNQMLDVNNQEFAVQLRRCMRTAWDAFDALRAS